MTVCFGSGLVDTLGMFGLVLLGRKMGFEFGVFSAYYWCPEIAYLL